MFFFFCSTIEYLGHIILEQGVSVDSKKVESIVEWPIPHTHTQTQLHSFLGLVRYYRRFIKGYALITTPLIDLLQRDNFL